MTDITTLQQENTLLKKKLEIAQKWMKREVSGQIRKIARQQISESTLEEKTCFLHENVDEIVSKKIQEFFGEIMLLNIPSSIIENIISAEINYYNFRHNPKSDGFAIISSYHKALDIIIEKYITSGFRKYFNKKYPQSFSPENDSIEKALFSVVTKKYNLSAGRLFHIIKLIREGEKLGDYVQVFKKYLEKYDFLNTMLIQDDDFFELYNQIIETEVLGSKRHSGIISFVDTREARKILIGEFREKNCLIYKLIELGEV